MTSGSLKEQTTGREMPDLTALRDGNRRFAEQFEARNLNIRPRMSTILLSCVDARVDPAHVFSFGLGDALVLRNAGGRITPAVLRDLAILGVLAAGLPGNAVQPQLVIIHHTDCGMARLANPPIQQQVAKRLGLSDDEVAAMAVTDPTKTVQADIEQLRQLPGTPDALIVTGLVYDVSNGTINQVVPSAPLRART